MGLGGFFVIAASISLTTTLPRKCISSRVGPCAEDGGDGGHFDSAGGVWSYELPFKTPYPLAYAELLRDGVWVGSSGSFTHPHSCIQRGSCSHTFLSLDAEWKVSN